MKKIVCISATSRPDNDTAKALGVVTAELAALGCEPEVVDARNLRLAFPGEAQTDDWLRLEVAVRSVQATPAETTTDDQVFLQLRGEFSVTGELTGIPISDRRQGFFETYVPDFSVPASSGVRP